MSGDPFAGLSNTPSPAPAPAPAPAGTAAGTAPPAPAAATQPLALRSPRSLEQLLGCRGLLDGVRADGGAGWPEKHAETAEAEAGPFRALALALLDLSRTCGLVLSDETTVEVLAQKQLGKVGSVTYTLNEAAERCTWLRRCCCCCY